MRLRGLGPEGAEGGEGAEGAKGAKGAEGAEDAQMAKVAENLLSLNPQQQNLKIQATGPRGAG